MTDVQPEHIMPPAVAVASKEVLCEESDPLHLLHRQRKVLPEEEASFYSTVSPSIRSKYSCFT